MIFLETIYIENVTSTTGLMINQVAGVFPVLICTVIIFVLVGVGISNINSIRFSLVNEKRFIL